MTRLTNKIALITGAARGIGAATAALMIQEGATVILTDILDDEGKALQKKLGEKAIYHHLDVSKESDWQKMAAFIKTTFKHLNILFNNAGIIGFEPELGPQDPENVSLQSWHKVHAVNNDGVFLGCKYGIALMKEQGGSIINMSSRSGVVGIPLAAPYAASKAAIRNHTKSVALYCAQKNYGIRCNSLHPGAILTPMWDAMLGGDENTKQQAIATISAGIPIGHMGEPNDVAYAVIYLASDESKYLTGIELTIDGGILAGSHAAPGKKD